MSESDEDHALTLPLTSSGKPKRNSPPTRIKTMIAELGIRYRPTSQADIDAHGRSLDLLCGDLADAPPDLLEKAIAVHVRASVYLPKAADLIKLMQGLLSQAKPPTGTSKRLDVATIRNAQMDNDPRARQDIRWVDDKFGLRLVPIAQYQAR